MKSKLSTHTTTRSAAQVLALTALGFMLAGCGGQQTATPPPASAPDASTAANPVVANPAQQAAGGAKTADAAAFKDAAAQWAQINQANAALDKVVKSGKLDVVHEAAFKVRDLVKALPAKSPALAPDKQAMLAAQVKNVVQIASMLDESGDAKKLKDVQDNQASLNDALAIIKGVYPPGSLK